MSGIQMALMGAGEDTVKLSAQNIDHFSFSPNTADLEYQLTNTGKVQQRLDGGIWTDLEDWVTPNGNAALYELKVTLNSGTLDAGTTGSWVSLAGTQLYQVHQTSVGIQQANMTFEIRKASTAIVMATATIVLTATEEI